MSENHNDEFLTGTVYIGVVGAEWAPVNATLSIANIKRREGDSRVNYSMQTKGFEGRARHVRLFLESEHDFLLMLDGDMKFAPETLERLRSHGRAFVTGFYTRRELPTYPVWFEERPLDEWPKLPFLRIPEEGRLHRLGGTGWGCALIHRCVFEGVEKLLHGMPFVYEEPMYFWPYDAEAVLRGEARPVPLTGNWLNVGSDVRFCHFARAAGFTIWGDPDVRAGHYLTVPIGWNELRLSEGLSVVQERYEKELPVLLERHRRRMAELDAIARGTPAAEGNKQWVVADALASPAPQETGGVAQWWRGQAEAQCSSEPLAESADNDA